MARLLNRKRKKKGSPPGTVVHVGERKISEVVVTAFEYDENSCSEIKIDDVAKCHELLASPTCTWINVDGLHDTRLMEVLGKSVGLHALVLEDIVNTSQRPKVEQFDTYTFVVTKMLSYNPKDQSIKVEQVSFILGDRFVISFQEDEGDLFDDVRQRLRTGKGRLRREGADFLLYSLLDRVVDEYFDILEALGDELDKLESQLVDKPTAKTLHGIYALKREVVYVRRAVWPLRECINAMIRDESEIIRANTRIFMRDLYDHTIHVIDAVETLRDLSAGMLDLYLSTASNRMNETMKVLTVMSSVFVPLTFIAGIYGMNFKDMPELNEPWGYPVALGLMTITAIGLLAVFRFKRWS